MTKTTKRLAILKLTDSLIIMPLFDFMRQTCRTLWRT